MKKKPHLLIFNPDQWRGDVLGHQGNPAALTPNLDRLAREEAVSFSRAFCQNPVCTPSRCSFMTGWYPHSRGHRIMHYMLREEEPMLLKDLKDNGYFVWWAGKNDVISLDTGFESYCDVFHMPAEGSVRFSQYDDSSGWRGDPAGDNFFSFLHGPVDPPDGEAHLPDSDWARIHATIELIDNWDPSSSKPLCLFLPLGYPHPPYCVERKYFDRIDRARLPARISIPEDWSGRPSMERGLYELCRMAGWSDERWDDLRVTYYAMAHRVDEQFGMILDALRRKGIYDDTAIFMFSDHGDYAGDYGLVEKTQNTFADCLSRVPFIIKPPADQPCAPGNRDALVELVDFPATVYDLCGITPNHTHFGRSLLGQLAAPGQEHRDAVFCEGGRLPQETHTREKESEGYNTPDALYGPRMGLQAKDGPEHIKAVMVRDKRYKYVRRLAETDEFYDLQRDPTEEHNRIDDPVYAAEIIRLKDRMLTWFLETGDVVPFKLDRRW